MAPNKNQVKKLMAMSKRVHRCEGAMKLTALEDLDTYCRDIVLQMSAGEVIEAAAMWLRDSSLNNAALNKI